MFIIIGPYRKGTIVDNSLYGQVHVISSYLILCAGVDGTFLVEHRFIMLLSCRLSTSGRFLQMGMKWTPLDYGLEPVDI